MHRGSAYRIWGLACSYRPLADNYTQMSWGFLKSQVGRRGKQRGSICHNPGAGERSLAVLIQPAGEAIPALMSLPLMAERSLQDGSSKAFLDDHDGSQTSHLGGVQTGEPTPPPGRCYKMSPSHCVELWLEAGEMFPVHQQ
jgi:hypothetical protein